MHIDQRAASSRDCSFALVTMQYFNIVMMCILLLNLSGMGQGYYFEGMKF